MKYQRKALKRKAPIAKKKATSSNSFFFSHPNSDIAEEIQKVAKEARTKHRAKIKRTQDSADGKVAIDKQLVDMASEDMVDVLKDKGIKHAEVIVTVIQAGEVIQFTTKI